jgi:hypothetical protein
MSEKKRVTVVVDAKSQPVAREAFAIPSFDSSQHRQRQHPGLQGADDDEDLTDYQNSRQSIVPGVDAKDLLLQHRKSLAQFSQNAAAPMSDFSGVTLSRRHKATTEAYDEKRDESTSEKLETFTFGSAE